MTIYKYSVYHPALNLKIKKIIKKSLKIPNGIQKSNVEEEQTALQIANFRRIKTFFDSNCTNDVEFGRHFYRYLQYY